MACVLAAASVSAPVGCVCRVIAWEPVKIFQAYMEYGIARNRLQHKVNPTWLP
jgi:hypothetical protein